MPTNCNYGLFCKLNFSIIWDVLFNFLNSSDGSEWQPSNGSRICSRHFVGNEKSNNPTAPNYMPTLKGNSDGKNEDSAKDKTSNEEIKDDSPPQNKGKVCQCNLQGCSNLTLQQKTKIFSAFLRKSCTEQSSILSSCIKKEPTKGIGDKKPSFSYYVRVNGAKIQVCRDTLCNVYSVRDTRIEDLQYKMKSDITQPKIRQRKMKQMRCVSDVDYEFVREHISSIPTVESSIIAEGKDTRYLSSSLNITSMFRLFKEKYPFSKAKIWLYRKVLQEEFKLTYGQPRSETCTACQHLYIRFVAAEDETVSGVAMQESLVHHIESEKGYTHLHEDICASKANESIVTLCMDLQRIISVPMLADDDIFYRRQLSCYNTAVHNPTSNHATMHIWNETVAKNGAMDIASCFLHYIVTHYNRISDHHERKLVLWLDRTVGQNSDWHVLFLLVYLIQQKYFTSVEQKFLDGGHSFLPCDRDFALIERRLRANPVMVPSQLEESIRSARPSNPFDVYFMRQDDFKDLKVLEKSLARNAQLQINNAMWIKLCSRDPHNMQVRESHSVLEPWKYYGITRTDKQGTRTKPVRLPDVLPKCYNAPVRLQPEKLRDLVELLPNIPAEHVDFYKCLF